jgi:hypothetical protein
LIDILHRWSNVHSPLLRWMHAPLRVEVEEKKSNLMANFALFEPLIDRCSRSASDPRRSATRASVSPGRTGRKELRQILQVKLHHHRKLWRQMRIAMHELVARCDEVPAERPVFGGRPIFEIRFGEASLLHRTVFWSAALSGLRKIRRCDLGLRFSRLSAYLAIMGLNPFAVARKSSMCSTYSNRSIGNRQRRHDRVYFSLCRHRKLCDPESGRGRRRCLCAWSQRRSL